MDDFFLISIDFPGINSGDDFVTISHAMQCCVSVKRFINSGIFLPLFNMFFTTTPNLLRSMFLPYFSKKTGLVFECTSGADFNFQCSSTATTVDGKKGEEVLSNGGL